MGETALIKMHPERVMAAQTDIDEIDKFIGYDCSMRTKRRRARKSASPEFIITIRDEHDGHEHEDDFLATIVATNISSTSTTTNIAPGSPVAIAEVLIDDEAWYLLVSTSMGGIDNPLMLSDVLIQHDGEPEGLLERPELFEPDDD
jgi:hypothetical protein